MCDDHALTHKVSFVQKPKGEYNVPNFTVKIDYKQIPPKYYLSNWFNVFNSFCHSNAILWLFFWVKHIPYQP